MYKMLIIYLHTVITAIKISTKCQAVNLKIRGVIILTIGYKY